MVNNVKATLVLRNDLAATWASRDPILARGEIGAEIDTGLLKIGDGSTSFNNLRYINQGRGGDGALITSVNNYLTIANYGHSYWVYDNESARDIEVVEPDLSKWPPTLELEIKNHVARWVVPKISYNRTQGTLDGALITLARDPMYSNEAATMNYVQDYVRDAIVQAPHLRRSIVTELPTEYLDINTIYMLKDDSVAGVDKYKEYIAIENDEQQLELVLIGDTSVDLTNYLRKPNNFVEGHLPALAADGSLIDSGIAASQINSVNIATTTTAGVVYSSTLDNMVSVNNAGFMLVNKITAEGKVATDALYVPDGSEFVLNGGGA